MFKFHLVQFPYRDKYRWADNNKAKDTEKDDALFWYAELNTAEDIIIWTKGNDSKMVKEGTKTLLEFNEDCNGDAKRLANMMSHNVMWAKKKNVFEAMLSIKLSSGQTVIPLREEIEFLTDRVNLYYKEIKLRGKCYIMAHGTVYGSDFDLHGGKIIATVEANDFEEAEKIWKTKRKNN